MNKQSSANSPDCSLWLSRAFFAMFCFCISLDYYIFTFIQLLIKSFFYELVFAILGITQSFLFNNTVCWSPRHVTFFFKKKKKANPFPTFSMWLGVSWPIHIKLIWCTLVLTFDKIHGLKFRLEVDNKSNCLNDPTG